MLHCYTEILLYCYTVILLHYYTVLLFKKNKITALSAIIPSCPGHVIRLPLPESVVWVLAASQWPDMQPGALEANMKHACIFASYADALDPLDISNNKNRKSCAK